MSNAMPDWMQGGRVAAPENGGGLTIAEQAGIEEVGALAPGLQREPPKAQRFARERKIDECQLIICTIRSPAARGRCHRVEHGCQRRRRWPGRSLRQRAARAAIMSARASITKTGLNRRRDPRVVRGRLHAAPDGPLHLKGWAGGVRRVSAAARAVDAVPGILRRPAFLSRLPDSFGLAAQVGHTALHHRHAVLGRDRLLASSFFGRRSSIACRCRCSEESARPAPQLDAARTGGHRLWATQSVLE